MKNKYIVPSQLVIIILLGALLFFSNCSISKKSSEANQPIQDKNHNLVVPDHNQGSPLSWENLFRKVAGVQVTGSYPNLSLKIRGASSINLTTEPLFVLEGVPLGHKFINLERAITPQNVLSIEVLKGPDAAIYGSRASNGVIVVKQKKQ